MTFKIRRLLFSIFCGAAVLLQILEARATIMGSVESVDLAGTWTLNNSNGSISIIGKVPGSMYTDLMRQGMIGDPYYRFNDDLYRWVAHDNWTYSNLVQVSSSLLKKSKIVLICEGLDTVSTVYVNEHLVGQSDNMFVQYIFDVKLFLKEGSNNITVRFVSAPQYAKQRALHHSYTIPPACPPDVQHGECHVNFIRKQQCSFSWDWGPSFPTQGIWKNISLQAFDSAVLRDVTLETIPGSDLSLWTIRIQTFYDVSGEAVTGDLVVTIKELSLTVSKNVSVDSSNPVMMDIPVDKSHSADLWWPNGHGKQVLYTAEVYFTSLKTQEMTGKSLRFGFRSVSLVQEKIANSSGLSFYFEINKKPMFMKGSNWIPADIFQERIDESRLRNLLQSAADANMNMLRVWGGGIYEQDAFYDIADELGILIWQDFMFACALYPVDDTFLSSVKLEVTQQIRRLKHHPSIAIWAGNNENEAALGTNWFNIPKTDYLHYLSNFVSLYIDTIMPIVQSEDSSRPFVSSSPTNGLKSASEGWVSSNPYDTHYGDVHTYNYFDDSWDWKTVPRPRFASEYGFQSWPSISSLTNVTIAEDLNYYGPFTNHRQHHENGNLQMLSEAMRHMKIPYFSSTTDTFKALIFITQINQAVSIKTQTEFYLRSQSEIVEGEGHTMGALYWQLNDIWQAPTWSSLEYNGKWKMLHYFARRFFAPTLLSPYVDGEIVKVYLVQNEIASVSKRPVTDNDINSNLVYTHDQTQEEYVYGFELDSYDRTLNKMADMSNYLQETPSVVYVSCYRWDQFRPLETWKQAIKVTKTAESVFESDIDTLLDGAGCPLQKQCFLTFNLDTVEKNIPDNFIAFNSWEAAVGFLPANVKVTGVVKTGQTFTVTLSSDHIAAFVTLDSGQLKGRFSDNGFLMVMPKLMVVFFPWQSMTVELLQKELTVTSLNDLYSSGP